MDNFLKLIESKIKQSIKIESILIIDNSNKHKKHKFFDIKKYHLKLEIQSIYLNSLNKLQAQREVMKVLKIELQNKIHAIEIQIK
tara:strand:+ start:284 stop:538 length:255 start_codon:yes stop_codon:yes gene_type:complete